MGHLSLPSAHPLNIGYTARCRQHPRKAATDAFSKRDTAQDTLGICAEKSVH
jgi:hypothetical protein